MNNWILFQLIVDIALFAIIIFYIIKENRPETPSRETGGPQVDQVDIKQLESLMDELAKLVMRAERVSERMEKGINQDPTKDNSYKNRKKTPAPDSGGDAYANAAKLIKKGLTDDEIGKRLGLPSHEVSLIRNIAT